MRPTRMAALAALVIVATVGLSARRPAPSPGSEQPRRECVMLQALDGSAPFVSDPAECAVKTAPASTFKVPHALIALETGVVRDARALSKWDRTAQPFPAWERDHSLDSAMKASVVWYFRRTAALIGRARMQQSLTKIGYARDTFDGDVTSFWLNGDLAVSPEEQLGFLRRLVQYEIPVERAHVEVVKAAMTMPAGAITNASGTHPFPLAVTGRLVVRAKTGNATIAGERVSWLIGQIESAGRACVFVGRVRASSDLPGTAGSDLVNRVLNERLPALLTRTRG